jgi:hypothetical protein
MTKIIYTWCMDVSTGTTTTTGNVCELYGEEHNVFYGGFNEPSLFRNLYKYRFEYWLYSYNKRSLNIPKG